ncbi:bifunctional pyrimidine regulatory protein PyrR uracil phosphoribosyltransferase [Candidatus Magnetobacterium bavaricum]|uniref:Bifunctional protein PyrR n=1 Tax=Candidatus Magnetobacterium bavaricum TaxID=29290 RepID=A0A0F3GU23_9BACT|nr:bifunctional pyrimidine regulatory protein PyrR uracil phosphoribosyltransferase [Candidatus Magnetobacterium bavaricum]
MNKEILNSKDISRIISRIAHEIIERNRGCKGLCIVGIQQGGVQLADRIVEKIRAIEKVDVLPSASLDISFYRDDLGIRKTQPVVRETHMPVDISGKTIILVDDVIYTGRTVRAAMDALMDFGRPAQIQLVVLIDRGHRELPIRPDYVGKNVPTSKTENIKVLLEGRDQEDKVYIQRS